VRNIPVQEAPSSAPSIDIIAALAKLIEKKDLMNWMMGQYNQLNHVSAGVYKVLNDAKANNCGGSIDTLSEMLTK
jgi:hypothetical protein